MSNYDFLGTKERHHIYPLKIYLSKDNTVVVMYTGALFSENFQIQNTTCVISKDYFYKVIDELKKFKTATIRDGEISIKIDIYEKKCNVTVGNKNTFIEVKEEDLRFQQWLLSIDLRKAKRVKTLIPVSVESEFSFEYGAVLDISQTGFKIALNAKLNSLDSVSLSIFDDEFPVGEIYCAIKHETMKNGKYIYGLEIERVSNEAEYRLNEIFNRECKKEF